jgi:stage V sporulation protein B
LKSSKGVSYLFGAQIAFMLSGYLTNVWLGRDLGPELYGVYGVLTSLMTAMNIMQVSGVPQAVSKYIAEDETQADAILTAAIKIQLGLTILISAIFFLAAPLMAHVFHDSRFTGYARLMALVFPTYGLFALYSGYYNGKHNFRRQSLMNIVYSIFKLVLVIGLVIQFSIYGVIIAYVLAALAGLTAGMHIPKTKTYYPKKLIFKYSLPLIGFAVLATMQLSVDLFSVKAFIHNSYTAGIYTAAQNIMMIPYLAMGTIGQVLFPSISRLKSKNNQKELERIVSSALKNVIITLIPLTAIIAGSAPTLVHLLYGSKYEATAKIVRILSIGYIGLTIFALAANVLNGIGRAKTAMLIAGGGVLTALTGCLIFVPKYGAVAAACSTDVGGVLVATVSLYAMRGSVKYQIKVQTLLRVAFASVVLFALTYFIQPHVLILPFWWILLAAAYLTYMYYSYEVSFGIYGNLVLIINYINKYPIDKAKRISRIVALYGSGLLVAYLLFTNSVPFTLHKSYSQGNGHISSLVPNNRAIQENGYTKQVSDLTYFNTDMPIAFNSAKVKVTYKVKNPNQEIYVGFKNSPEYNFDKKVLDAPFIDKLNWNRIGNGPYVYQKTPAFSSVSQIKSNLAMDQVIGSFDYNSSTLIAANTKISNYTPTNYQTNINVPLRGQFTMYMYLNKEKFHLKLIKRDLNWYPDQDVAHITVYRGDTKVLSTAIQDDGNLSANHVLGKAQTAEINSSGNNFPASGIYKVVVDEPQDSVVTNISTNLSKIVFAGPIYPVSNHQVYGSLVSSTQSTTLYTNSLILSAYTDHQTPKTIITGSQKSSLRTASQVETFHLSNVSNNSIEPIQLPNSDAVINGSGFFSFLPQEFFEPSLYQVLPITNMSDVSQVGLILSNYKSSSLDKNGWRSTTLNFNIKTSYPDNGQLTWVIDAPGLKNSNSEVDIKSINVSFTKNGWLK